MKTVWNDARQQVKYKEKLVNFDKRLDKNFTNILPLYSKCL